MKNLIITLILLISSKAYAIGVVRCSARPMTQKEFSKLEKELYKVSPMLQKLNISSADHCDEIGYESETIYYGPYLIDGPYEEFYRVSCSRNSEKQWSCMRPIQVAIFQYKNRNIIIEGNIKRHVIAKLIEFIQSLETHSFDKVFKHGSPISQDELARYKEIDSISYDGNIFSVLVKGGKYGNYIEIQRIVCGLDHCSFEIKSLQRVLVE